MPVKTLMKIIENDPIWIIYISFFVLFFTLIISSCFNGYKIDRFQKEAISRGYATYVDGEFIWKPNNNMGDK